MRQGFNAVWGFQNNHRPGLRLQLQHSLVTLARHDYVVDSNWKVLSENYNECYHCPTIHPELCAVSPPDSGGDYNGAGAWVGGWMELMDGGQTMSLSGVSEGVAIEGLPTELGHTVGYVDVFPNLLISVHPDYVMSHKLTPLSPTTPPHSADAAASSTFSTSPRRPQRKTASPPRGDGRATTGPRSSPSPKGSAATSTS